MDLAKQIISGAKKTGADPYTLLASAIVESGLNPRAVGDGGTSFGLWQMHVGGAGGPNLASAKRYFDPMLSIDNRSRAFKGGKGGSWAASVQRPADQAGYARKVDSVIAQLRSGKSPYSGAFKGQLNAPVAGESLTGASESKPAVDAGGGARKAMALSLIFGDDPVMQMVSNRIARQDSAPAQPATSNVASPPNVTGQDATRKALVNSAKAEIGTVASQAMKYIREAGGTGYEAWCGDFVQAMFKQNGLPAPPARSVPRLLDWAKKNNKLSQTGRAGDLAMFDWNSDGTPDHVEMVVGGRGPGRYATIGGNTSGPKAASQVANKIRSSNILGFASAV